MYRCYLLALAHRNTGVIVGVGRYSENTPTLPMRLVALQLAETQGKSYQEAYDAMESYIDQAQLLFGPAIGDMVQNDCRRIAR